MLPQSTNSLKADVRTLNAHYILEIMIGDLSLLHTSCFNQILVVTDAGDAPFLSHLWYHNQVYFSCGGHESRPKGPYQIRKRAAEERSLKRRTEETTHMIL